MTHVSFSAAQVERFRKLIANRLGLFFDDSKLAFLQEILQRRLTAGSFRCDRYLDGLEGDQPGAELLSLGRELTIGETYFFRHREQMRAFAELALPTRISARQTAAEGARTLRLLSAGCATGEEPYSLSILTREMLGQSPGSRLRAGNAERLNDSCSWDVSITGLDLNPASLERARLGLYSAWALRETPEDVRARWFSKDGSDFRLDPAVVSSVTFLQRNLTLEDAELWAPETYDVVFCRNVMMYFTPEHARALVSRIANALVPGGYLFLGHAETLRGMPGGLHLLNTHDAFYYQRKHGSEKPKTSPPLTTNWSSGYLAAPTLSRAALPTNLDSGPPRVESKDSWIEAIRAASERIKLLSAPAEPSDKAPSPAPAEPSWDLGAAHDLFKQERFREALGLLEGMPPVPDVLLLRAVLLVHTGQLSRAEEVARQLLQGDRMTAGAHYVLALCQEAIDDPKSAADHHRASCQADPRFAMPRLHLGLLARRAGDSMSARRELNQALFLLERENSSRLLLFGGGFGREALLTMCRSELKASGGPP
jgi:chemotaxis protein methyltransferase CheR